MRFTEEQSRIIDAPINDDLLVIAGAGSGKTMTMTNRIVSLIKRGVLPESILGLTFTNKAASELLSRVSAAVSVHTEGKVIDPTFAFLKPEVRTYDAFFQSIVRQYGLLVGVDQATQPLSEAGAYQLAANVVQEHLDEIFGFESNNAGATFNEDSVEFDRSVNDDPGAFDSTVNQLLSLSRACADAMISENCPTFEDAVERVHHWDREFNHKLDELIDKEQIPDKCPSITAITKPKKAVKRRKETPEDKFAEFLETRHSYRLYTADQLRKVVHKRERLLKLVMYYQQAKREAGMAEFSDFTLAAFQLVTRFPAIGASYRRRFTHVFLDEYQDTSTTQALLLAAIFHPKNNQSHHEEHETIGKNKVQAAPVCSSVTAVGDPFQSIYAWRGASPGAFKTFQREFDMDSSSLDVSHAFGHQAPEPLTLTQTFRNSRMVLEAANFLTIPLRQGRLSNKPRTSALLEEVSVDELSERENADQGTLGLLGYQTVGQEIDGVVRFVKEAKRRYGQSDQTQSDANAPHVAVLFRSKNAMPQYQQALEEAGLNVQVVGYSALFERPEIMDLLALLHVICDHTDYASLLRLLASSRFNMTAADLTAFSNLTAQLNTESQYKALVESGVVSAGLQGQDLADAVQQYRDRVPIGVFLVDVLLRDDLEELLFSAQASRISSRGRSLLLKAGKILAQARAQVTAPLRQAVSAAARALDLDIDLVVAQSMRSNNSFLDASGSTASLDAFLKEVDAYVQELPEGMNASMTGFISWIDSMRKSPNDPASGLDSRADVVLMTIHQAKGLEWDAVAVVGAKRNVFPSSQGDRLTIEPLNNWEECSSFMEYESTAKTWLNDPAAVPVPVRADANILPRFPHDASYENASAGGYDFLTLTSLEDEVAGQIRKASGFVDDSKASPGAEDQEVIVNEIDSNSEFLNQPQEYGLRLHNDERRLAYVALTRARHDLLVTFSFESSNVAPSLLLKAADSQENNPKDDVLTNEKVSEQVLASASNFWRELHMHFSKQPEVILPGSGANQLEKDNEPQTSENFTPLGVFVGEHAKDYEEIIIEQALQEAPQLKTASASSPASLWPVHLSERLRKALTSSAMRVDEKKRKVVQQSDKGYSNTLYAHSVRLMKAGSGRLGVQGNLLVKDVETLKQVGARVINQEAQSVTTVQKRSNLKEEEEQQYWRNVVRPLPYVASPLAEAGTIFHDWAANFILPQLSSDPGLVRREEDLEQFNFDDSKDSDRIIVPGLGIEQQIERRRLLAELSSQESESLSQMQELKHLGDEKAKKKADRQKQILTWKRRLAESFWARRKPEWVERPIVAVVAGQLVKGKLDAVFAGSIDDGEDAQKCTIVDWKTGHKPLSAQERDFKLAQLDLYRLLLARMENRPLDSIDACLYYVSEDDFSQRLISAKPRNEQDIEARVKQGLPEQSDND